MTVFWSLVVIMLLASVFVVVRHLMFTQQLGNAAAAEKPALSIFRQRLRELERERADGVITAEQMQTARLELEQSLLDEVNLPAGGVFSVTGNILPDWKTAGLIGIFIPVVALGLYFELGQPRIIEALRQSAIHGAGDHQEQLASIEDMVASLAARMQNNPDDLEGWIMLARSYKALGRFDQAVSAYEHVYSMAGDDVGVMLQYADVLAMAGGGRMSGKPAELVQRALALSPDNSMGLWLAGMAAREQGDNNAALAYWQRLLPQVEDDAESYQQVRELIRAAQQDLGLVAADSEIQTGTQPQSEPSGEKSIRVKVRLAEALTGKAGPEDTLFIFARAVTGPPMPLAAARKQVRDLPLEIVLDDTMAMMPALKLSGYDSVRVNARISKSGTPAESSGDMVAEAVTAAPGQEQTVELVIESVIP